MACEQETEILGRSFLKERERKLTVQQSLNLPFEECSSRRGVLVEQTEDELVPRSELGDPRVGSSRSEIQQSLGHLDERLFCSYGHGKISFEDL